MNNRRSRKGLWIGVLLVLAVWLVWLGTKFLSERHLLKCATRYCRIERGDILHPMGYYWLTDSTVLILHGQPGQFIKVDGINYFSMGLTGRGALMVCDLKTGRETPLPALNRWLSQQRSGMAQLQVSPDGSRLLLQADDGRIAWTTPDDASLHLMPKHDPHIGAFWMPDSRHWLEIQYYGPLIGHLYDTDNPGSEVTLPIQANSPLSRYALFLSSGNVTRDRRLLIDTIYGSGSPPGTSYSIAEMRLENPVTLSHHYTIHLPQDATLLDRCYSPQGDRVAWIFSVVRLPVLSAVLKRFVPTYRDKLQQMLCVWVSRLDGSDMHEIAFQEIDEHNRGTLENLSSFQFAPDGKRIGFLYNGYFYTIPAD